MIKDGRLTRLIKFTGSEAKELTNHSIQLPPKIGYETACGLLNNRYGNPRYWHASNKEEVKALPSVKLGDASRFRKFYSFALKFETYCTGVCMEVLPQKRQK